MLMTGGCFWLLFAGLENGFVGYKIFFVAFERRNSLTPS